MESTPRLYDTLVQVLSQHQNWVDLRHLKTLAWMIVGLMPSGKSASRLGRPTYIAEPCMRRGRCFKGVDVL
jgi:signal recognition particle GTPase